MTLAQDLTAEVEKDAARTRKLLAVVPADKLDLKPREKSMSRGQLTVHLRLLDVPVPATFGDSADEPMSQPA